MKNWKYIDGAKVGNAVTDKEFKSEADLRRWCMEHNYTYTPVGGGYYRLEDDKPGSRRVDIEAHVTGNKKTGNDTPAEYFSKKPKVIGNEKTGAEGFFKQLSEDVKEREKKDDKDIEKVGNTWTAIKQPDGKYMPVEEGFSYEFNGKKVKVVKINGNEIKLSDGQVIKGGPSGQTVKVEMKKVGNALNWDENLVGKFVWVKDKGQEWKVYVMQDKGDKVYIRDDEDGSQGWVSKTRITGKVGNSKIGNSTVSEYNAEIQRLTKKAEQLRRMGQGRQAMEVEKQIEKLGKELSEIGNSAHSDKVDVIKRLLSAKWSVDEIFSLLKKEGYEVEKSFIERLKTGNKVGNSKIGNEASDDKFAYVMREFDEGKLKTPDGKIVTDPAQAKAIAYSESKKTENGLARARNAIKKS